MCVCVDLHARPLEATEEPQGRLASLTACLCTSSLQGLLLFEVKRGEAGGRGKHRGGLRSEWMQPCPLHLLHRGTTVWQSDQRRERRPTGETPSCSDAQDGRKDKLIHKSSCAANTYFHFGFSPLTILSVYSIFVYCKVSLGGVQGSDK